MQPCEICTRLSSAGLGQSPQLIHRFESSLLFLGDHQFFEGYCVLMLKDHVRELHEMPEVAYGAFMLELRQASQAIARAFKPWKLNHACLGNVVPHLHWHIVPRYESDPNHLQNPWYDMDHFKGHGPSSSQQQALIEKIRRELKG